MQCEEVISLQIVRLTLSRVLYYTDRGAPAAQQVRPSKWQKLKSIILGNPDMVEDQSTKPPLTSVPRRPSDSRAMLKSSSNGSVISESR